MIDCIRKLSNNYREIYCSFLSIVTVYSILSPITGGEMFKNSSGGVTKFESSWRKEKTVVENGTQTTAVSSKESSSQVTQKGSTGVQTDKYDTRNKNIDVAVDYQALALFLQKVSPQICEYLEKNSHSHAYDDYSLLTDETRSETQQLHTLKYNQQSSEFQCLDISWNSTGSILAAGYGMPSHDDWCNHEAVIAMWNTDRKDFDGKKPNQVIECNSCISSLAFHPNAPSVLAGGKFNGEIAVWNMAKDDDTLVAEAATHHEAVTNMCWIRSENQAEYLLVTCSLDGKILVWKLDDANHKLKCIQRFILLAEKLPRSLTIRSKRPNAEVGITCMSFNSEDRSIFIIGTEGGGVFQCSMDSRDLVNYSTSATPYMSPVVISFFHHLGHISSVHCSPFLRNAFLSCSSDGEIHIYTLLQPKPVLILKTLSGFQKAEWSPVHPLVICAITRDGHLLIYNFSDNVSVPSDSFAISRDIPGCTLHFNTQSDGQILATSTDDGNIQIWQLGSDFVVSSEKEKQELAKLISSAE